MSDAQRKKLRNMKGENVHVNKIRVQFRDCCDVRLLKENCASERWGFSKTSTYKL